MPNAAEARGQANQPRRLLRLYHLYRLGVGITLVLLISANMEDKLLELADGEIFRKGSWCYLIFNILVVVLLENIRRPAMMSALALTDVVMLSGLFYAGGGTPSGIGSLIIASVAMANLILRARAGLLIAALATIGIIYPTIYMSLTRPLAASEYLQSSMVGILCFAVAMMMQAMARLLRVSQEEAEQRASDVISLEKLNALILQRMRTGILVLDAEQRVLLCNQGAANLLDQKHLTGRRLGQFNSELENDLSQWQANPTLRPRSLRVIPGGPLLQARFIALNPGEPQRVLVFLEDLAQVAQQAQQLKLAALGRLTAGIAHEIRNPLGAISHAAQLLQESEALDDNDKRLTQIVLDQSRRMNLVVENVLQLSRRRAGVASTLELNTWLQRYTDDFGRTASERQCLHLILPPHPLHTRIDPDHLHQIVTNLVQNGLRYSGQRHGQAQVWLELSSSPRENLPMLEVLDDGAGFAPDSVPHMFEPFFTTESKGTGLGLYLSRELCESHQARLDYSPRTEGGSCLRITFARARMEPPDEPPPESPDRR